jgi:hypothetical protein
MSTKYFLLKMFFILNSFRGNDFATIKNFRPKYFSNQKHLGKKIFQRIFHPNCFRGNNFATIKNFRPKTFSTKKDFYPIYFRGTIKKCGPKYFRLKILFPNSFQGNDFATIKKFRPKNFRLKIFFIQKVSEEMILQQ